MTSTFRVAEDLVSHVALGCLVFDTVQVIVDPASTAPALPADTALLADRVALVRTMYRRLGLDPTKTRPSSEALLRRLRRGQRWPRVNSLVDASNECSLVTQLPFGVYDVDRIAGDVLLRRGRPNEGYEGIRKATVHVEGRPVLVDHVGPFGNPTSDSARTMVTTATTRALVVVYAPAPLDDRSLTQVLDLTERRVRDTSGGVEQRRSIVSAQRGQPAAD